jgi:predicted RNase H-like HicB family nuclease
VSEKTTAGGSREIPELPDVMAYGASKEEVEAAVEALALTLSQRTRRHGIA